MNTQKVFDMFHHGGDTPYEDHVVHEEPVYFLVDEQRKLFYQQQQPSPSSLSTSTEIRGIVQYNI
ncbi:hypothetical protein [Priestia aryabhattai]|uniref:hypothetical protein n=1 Tax=Priestia aryabhattai TaxID=412384 RepID=UPI00187714AC|nr:hypothetical protein [Priestia aryabhattai]MBE5098500.1 hypothetical protein [Priestia aryabhattai]